MKIPDLKEMLSAGVHFGHQTLRWNPKMKPYILAERNGIHIIDLSKTQEALKVAVEAINRTVHAHKSILFVGTKKSVKDSVKEQAQKCGMHYVTDRWLGGMLTNFATVKKSIGKLDKYDQMEKDGSFKELKKKEIGNMNKLRAKLDTVLGGIRTMKDQPGLLIIMDTKNEHIAVTEAKKLHIPVIGLVDSNSNPTEIDFPIPGNDDAIKSVSLIASVLADAVLEADKSKPAPVTKETAKTAAPEAEAAAVPEEATESEDNLATAGAKGAKK